MTKFTQPVPFCQGQQVTRTDCSVWLHPLPQVNWKHWIQQSWNQHSSSHQPPLVWNNFWLYLVHLFLVPKAKILITRLLILITTWHVENKTSYMCHLPQGEKKNESKLTNKIQNTALEEKSNLPLTKQFLRHSSLPVFVFLFFLRAIKRSILGIVGCFIDRELGFARNWLERGTSFWQLPGCPN